MSRVRIKVFLAKENHGQLQLDMNGFLAGEEASYVGHTVSIVSSPVDTYPSPSRRDYKTHYAGSIAYQEKKV